MLRSYIAFALLTIIACDGDELPPEEQPPEVDEVCVLELELEGHDGVFRFFQSEDLDDNTWRFGRPLRDRSCVWFSQWQGEEVKVVKHLQAGFDDTHVFLIGEKGWKTCVGGQIIECEFDDCPPPIEEDCDN